MGVKSSSFWHTYDYMSLYNSKVKKKVKFSNVVEVLGDTSVGGGVCTLSNWLKDISLLAWGGEL